MSQGFRRSDASDMNMWPGFVDALSALLLVIMFVLLIYVVAQFYLNDVLLGKDRSINAFQNKIHQLMTQLNLLETSNKKLESDLTGSLLTREQLAQEIKSLEKKSKESQDKILSADEQIALLNKQLEVFNEQVQKLNSALKVSEETVQTQKIQIDKLKIDDALVRKIQEMSKYRSDFFESLEKALGERDDVRIVGDRFVFQSEVLFDTASATLGEQGMETIDKLAKTLKEIIPKIPSEVNWVLRIDGHTDKRPIRSGFHSNWELSFARAMNVVRRLTSQGIPVDRLAAAGFGSNYPIDSKNTPEAYKKNRRIEIKLDQR